MNNLTGDKFSSVLTQRQRQMSLATLFYDWVIVYAKDFGSTSHEIWYNMQIVFLHYSSDHTSSSREQSGTLTTNKNFGNRKHQTKDMEPLYVTGNYWTEIVTPQTLIGLRCNTEENLKDTQLFTKLPKSCTSCHSRIYHSFLWPHKKPTV